MSGFIYIWRDRKNNRYYIGSHWGTEEDGYVCSSPWMKRSYERRPEDFKRRIISRVYTDREDLLKEEQRWIDMIDPGLIKPSNPDPRYYNLNLKVWGLWHTYPDSRKAIGQKISEAKLGLTELRTTLMTEIGRKISDAKKGKRFTQEHREAIGRAKLGHVQSEETKQKKSEALKQAYADGRKTAYWKGKEMPADVVDKISAGNKGKVRTEEHKATYAKVHSKPHLITFMDGASIVVPGLKEWAKEKGISYGTLTLYKYQKRSLKKHNILSIQDAI